MDSTTLLTKIRRPKALHAKLTIEDQARAVAYHENVTDSLKLIILSTSLSSSSLYILESHICRYPSKPSQDLHCHNKQAQLPMLQTLAFT